jgi:hypothetical protein
MLSELGVVWLRQGWPLFVYVHVLAERNNFVGTLGPLEGDPYI